MASNPNNCLGVRRGISPLAKRFVYLNFSYLVAAFCRLGHPLRLGVLGALNIGQCIRRYSDVLSLDIVPESFTRHELLALLGTSLEKLANVQKTMYSLVLVRKLWSVVHFFTDGSLIESCAGFAVHQMGVNGFGYTIQGPAAVFTAELCAPCTAL
jgi:hypothetical protein